MPQTVDAQAITAAVAIGRVGPSGSAVQDFADAISTDHRTLQQNAMRAMLAAIYALAQNRVDLRNEATVSVAQRIVEALGPDIPPLPYI